MIFLSQITFRLNYQHKNFTAIAKLKNYIEGSDTHYLKSRIKKNFVNLTEINEVALKSEDQFNDRQSIY